MNKTKKKLNKKKYFNLKNGLIFKKFQRKLSCVKKGIELILTEKECAILEYLLKEKKFLKNGGKLIFPLPDIEII